MFGMICVLMLHGMNGALYVTICVIPVLALNGLRA